jgi:UDP-N-acetylmuramoyl-tripeptide--D-alanyl-D-alanine ligase
MSYVVAVAYLFFAFRRLYRYLHMFQQEEYESPRFVRWMARTFSVDRKVTTLLLLIYGLQRLANLNTTIAFTGAALGLLVFGCLEPDPRKSAKKPLVMTERATRTFAVALAVDALWMLLAGAPLWTWVLAVQFVPFSLVIAELALRPFERRVKSHFLEEARQKLAALRPTVIGITGSYGKTSVKNILGHLLEAQATTLITQRNFNTLMGVTRVIREDLGRHHRFFVCEMGAYRIGSIAKLCDLTRPELAMITAVGFAHYERFKTLDTVAHAKFELAEAAIANGGRLIVAEDVLRLAYPAEFVARHADRCEIVGKGERCSFQLLGAEQRPEGMCTEIVWRGQSYALRAPLYGEHSAMNMAMSFAAACTLGMDPADVVLALHSVRQTSHRLEVRHEARGETVIDDAYNSNPLGFANGLELLELFQRNGGRRILVTPGMVEMGAAHDEEHAKIGTVAARHVDILLPVVPERIPTLVEAYKQASVGGVVVPCANFADARAWLDRNVHSGDVVLLENDLPDLYEARLKL